MKRIIIPTLLFSNILFSKSVPLKISLQLDGKTERIDLKNIGNNHQYKVKKGDTLSSIAHKHHISLKKLKRANHIAKNDQLKIGERLRIPERGKKHRTSHSSTLQSQGLATSGKPLLKEAKHHLGKRYVWGAVGPAKFDCSGFTSYVCKKSGISIPRTSIKQAEVGKKVNRKNLRAGDLIFFDTSKEHKGYVNHVGIYLGNNKFIHASSAKKRVMISSLNKHFYSNRFKWGRRIGS